MQPLYEALKKAMINKLEKHAGSLYILVPFNYCENIIKDNFPDKKYYYMDYNEYDFYILSKSEMEFFLDTANKYRTAYYEIYMPLLKYNNEEDLYQLIKSKKIEVKKKDNVKLIYSNRI